MRTEEDDEFDRIKREQDLRRAMAIKTNFESFDDWEHSHRPDQYCIERRAYLAGYADGIKAERLNKEIND